MSSFVPRRKSAPDFVALTNELREKLSPQFGQLLRVIGLRNELGLGGREWLDLIEALRSDPTPGNYSDKQAPGDACNKRSLQRAPKNWESMKEVLRPRRPSSEPEALATVTAEIDHLLGILAEAALCRIGLFTPYTTIIRELTKVAGEPRSFAAKRSRVSTEANTLIERQFLLMGRKTLASRIFGLTTKPRIAISEFGVAAARARKELESAYRRWKSGGEFPEDLLPFIRTPTSQSNERLAVALRRWMFVLIGKPTRVVQEGAAFSGADPVLAIVLGPLNETIEKYGGTPFSRDSLIRDIADRKLKPLK